MPGTEKSPLEFFVNEMKDSLKMLEEDSEELVMENYDRDIHWMKMGLACEAVSKECTKMAVAFSKPPKPTLEESKSLVKDIITSLSVLQAWHKTFPSTEGKLLNNILHQCIHSIVHSTHEFMKSVVYGKTTSGNVSKPCVDLVSVGTIWENVDKFKSLPRDNCSAAIQQVDIAYKMITDALNELQEDIRGYDRRILDNIDDDDDDDGIVEDNEEEWTKQDREFVKPCGGLIMASKVLLKKSKIALQSIRNNNINIENTFVDTLGHHVEKISPAVDDFVMTLCDAPLGHELVMSEANLLKSSIETVLHHFRSFSSFNTEDNQTWIDLIQKAVSNNIQKMTELMQK